MGELKESKGLVKAILSVMKDVKGIDKSLTVGTGNYSYKGVSDKDVKLVIGGAMQKHGLALIPTSVNPKTTIDTWDEKNQYGVKRKRQVFVEVETKYLLLHSSGESMDVSGYGHGIDQGDKAAGKATTYALKYAMLYLFLTPTGQIEDADTTHSNNIQVPEKTKPELIRESNEFEKAKVYILEGGDMAKIEKKYFLTEEIKKELKD